MFLPLLAFLALSPQASFDAWMARFEADKGKADWADAETSLKKALSIRQTDYAAHSLAWVYGRQNRVAESLELSKQVVARFGPTPMALHGLATASLQACDIATAKGAITQALQRGYQQGQGWVSESINDEARQLKELTTPAIYELEWTIPARDLKGPQPRKFLFPQANQISQTFRFTLPAGTKFETHDDGNMNVVSVWSDGSQDLLVHGRAVLKVATLPLAERRGSIPKAPALGPLFYYGERIDPAFPACVTLAGQLKKTGIWDTMQAIVDWRCQNITYADPPPGNTLETVLASKKGVCHHSSYLTVSLARACGIQADVVGGFALPEASTFKDAEGSHGWGELYLPGKGWVEYESQDNGSLGRFVARRHYLRYKAQNETKAFSADWISCQGYKVSGRRLQ